MSRQEPRHHVHCLGPLGTRWTRGPAGAVPSFGRRVQGGFRTGERGAQVSARELERGGAVQVQRLMDLIRAEGGSIYLQAGNTWLRAVNVGRTEERVWR